MRYRQDDLLDREQDVVFLRLLPYKARKPWIHLEKISTNWWKKYESKRTHQSLIV